MSENEEEEGETNSEDADAFDPLDPTKVDPQRAFELGAETPDANTAPAHWSPPEPEVLDPLFPDYDLIELIGRGGMGAVYRGTQKSLDRPVAIKVLPPEMAEADPSFAARFEREAKSMARLDHPNIVHVYDFGRTEAGHWFIVMEFVDGMDFHQLIRSGTLDQTGALNSVSQICDALHYAHEQGYVHRDIKPANIFINQKGILKVGDFGLAKMIEGDAEYPETRDQPILTQTGFSMGTPDYCAPEQIEGGPIDHRADIYSLGVMFYEMLTRELPRGNFPAPSKKVEIDVRIDDVVLRAMESEPERRYSTAGEMRSEVEEVRTTSTGETGTAASSTTGTEDGGAAERNAGDAERWQLRDILRSLPFLVIGGLLVGISLLVALGFLVWGPGKTVVRPEELSPEVRETGSSGSHSKRDPDDLIVSEINRYRCSVDTFQKFGLHQAREHGDSDQQRLQEFTRSPDVKLLDSYQAGVRALGQAEVHRVLELPYLDPSDEIQVRNVGSILEFSEGQASEPLQTYATLEIAGYEMEEGERFNSPLKALKAMPHFYTQEFGTSVSSQSGALKIVGSYKSGSPIESVIDVVIMNTRTRASNFPGKPIRFPVDRLAPTDPFAGVDDPFNEPIEPTVSSIELSPELPKEFPIQFAAEVAVYRLPFSEFASFVRDLEPDDPGLEEKAVLEEFLKRSEMELIDSLKFPLEIGQKGGTNSINEVTFSSGFDSQSSEPTIETRNTGSQVAVVVDLFDPFRTLTTVHLERVAFDTHQGAELDAVTGALNQFPGFVYTIIHTQVVTEPTDLIFLGTVRPGPPKEDMIELVVLRLEEKEP